MDVLQDDIDSDCWELHENGLLNCFHADYMASEVKLTNSGVIYMENRFPKGLKQVVKYLSTVFGIVSGAYGLFK